MAKPPRFKPIFKRCLDSQSLVADLPQLSMLSVVFVVIAKMWEI